MPRVLSIIHGSCLIELNILIIPSANVRTGDIFTMSDPYFANSQKSKYMRRRSKCVKNIFPSKSDGKNAGRCLSCTTQPYLQTERDNKGNVLGFCKSCGTKYPLQKNSDTKLFGSKYQVKYGNASGTSSSFVITRKDKRKRSGELDELDRKDLALLGSSGEGARLVESRESTYDSQSGWH
jgi:hypothetical protein